MNLKLDSDPYRQFTDLSMSTSDRYLHRFKTKTKENLKEGQIPPSEQFRNKNVKVYFVKLLDSTPKTRCNCYFCKFNIK